VLQWMAYPLQHPGAKMQTAIVMHGAEGTGKNLLWNAVRSIYGEYGVLITQTELEDKYNGWLSRKLFIIANEVISRQELRHHVGRLKNMITESPLPIRDMYMPLRYEANHANAVFLTNENRALQISPGDRRYTIIRTPGPKDEAYYTAVAAELKAGGAAALHKYLLELDCGEFNENTKPPATLAKDELIELGMSSAQRFQTELHHGLIWPLQYITCLSNDLYKAYLIWCGRSGERNPLNQPSFSSDFAHMNGVQRKVVDIEDPEQPHLQALKETQTKRRRQGTVFFMGEETDHLTPEGIKHYRTTCIRQFRQDLKDYSKQHDDLRRGGADEGGGERAHG
jgi:putative DNA primase/helicase